MPRLSRSFVFFFSAAVCGPFGAASPASGATKATFCREAKSLQVALLARDRLTDPSAPTYPKAHVAALDGLLRAQAGLEAKLSGDQKAILTAERKQTAKMRTAVAKGKTAMEQTQNAMQVLLDTTPQSTKALEAVTKLYPAIDKVCGTKLAGRRRS